MSKYLLFGGQIYYPCGGYSDYQEEFESLDEAVAYAKKKYPYAPHYEWWHVVHNGIIVKSKG